MKLLTTLLIFGLALCLGATTLNAQNVNIPDANFKAYLVGNAAINTNGDAEIQVSEASAFTGTIDCSALPISDLTGIEAFTSITELNCSGTLLSSLDVSQNTALEILDAGDNLLNNLDVSQNIALKTLLCSDLQLSNLDVSQNIGLESLSCSSNNLTSIDVSNNVNLESLYCQYNSINSLDVSTNTDLVILLCQSNSLINLNAANGNNTNFIFFYANSNPNLTCIQVDDSTYSANNWTNIDSTATFSTNCSLFSNINTINKEINLTAYPNPTTKAITLNFGKLYQEVTIQVTNLTGQVVLDKSIQSSFGTSVELEGAAGVYFVNIQTEVGSAMLKVIKA